MNENQENVKICLYFRTSGGRLHLLQDVGKIPLADATLIEEPNDSDKEDESKQIATHLRNFFRISLIFAFSFKLIQMFCRNAATTVVH